MPNSRSSSAFYSVISGAESPQTCLRKQIQGYLQETVHEKVQQTEQEQSYSCRAMDVLWLAGDTRLLHGEVV